MLLVSVLLSGICLVLAAVRDGCLSCEPPCLLRCACRMLGFCCKLSRLCAHLGSGGRSLENCPQEGCPVCNTVMTFVCVLAHRALPILLLVSLLPLLGSRFATTGFGLDFNSSCFALVWFGLIWYFLFRSAPHSLCSLPPRNSLNSLSHCCED